MSFAALLLRPAARSLKVRGSKGEGVYNQNYKVAKSTRSLKVQCSKGEGVYHQNYKVANRPVH